MNKRIINCAITGSIHTPTMSPYLPITPEEIANEAIAAANAGASTIHLHARDPKDGRPSSDLNLFREILERIREKNKDVVLCLTTGGGPGMTVEERLSVVPEFEPGLASMNAGSINWGLYPVAAKIKEWKYEWEPMYLAMTKDFIFRNTFEDMTTMLTTMKEHNTVPEIECYDVGHLYNIKFLQTQGLVPERPYLQFVLGINGGINATPYDLMAMKETADRLFGVNGYNWSTIGAGRHEFPICTQNLFLGGHVRVGLEDNLYLGKGRLAKSNAELVDKMVRIMKEFDFEPASPAEAREMLQIHPDGEYR